MVLAYGAGIFADMRIYNLSYIRLRGQKTRYIFSKIGKGQGAVR
jgi:hypothetical protein